MDSTSASILRRFAGQWVAWNRQQDRVICSGRTFEEAKQSAAAAGESAVILKKASDRAASPRWLYAVAVFIALSPGVLPVAATTASPFTATFVQCEAEADRDDLEQAE